MSVPVCVRAHGAHSAYTCAWLELRLVVFASASRECMRTPAPSPQCDWPPCPPTLRSDLFLQRRGVKERLFVFVCVCARAPGSGSLKDILALVGCIPEAELNLPATAVRLRAWCLSFGAGAAPPSASPSPSGPLLRPPREGVGGAGRMTWLSRQLAQHVSRYLLLSTHTRTADAVNGGAGGEHTSAGASAAARVGSQDLRDSLPDDVDVASICAKARVIAR